MSADIIVSYDGTPNDDDALVLGRALAQAGATMALAYVRHAHEFDPRREELAEHDAQRRLDAGLALLGDPDLETHVVMSASTDSGLERLAAAEEAKVIVFGSDYRTTPGRAEPGNTAQRLLEGAAVGVAVAQAGLRGLAEGLIRSIAVAPGDSLGAASEAAERLADQLGATLLTSGSAADLIVVASPPGGRPGRVSLSGSARAALNSSRGSVVILPAGSSAVL